MAEQTLSAQKLCALTGLTDRRHRQIAKEGYFPNPLAGQYQLTQTIQGMFRYLRERLEKKDDSLANERTKYMRARRQKAEIETAIMQGEYFSADEVSSKQRNIYLHQKAMLRLKLEVEEPPKLIGLDVPEIALRMKSIVKDICRIHREGMAQWMKELLKENH